MQVSERILQKQFPFEQLILRGTKLLMSLRTSAKFTRPCIDHRYHRDWDAHPHSIWRHGKCRPFVIVVIIEIITTIRSRRSCAGPSRRAQWGNVG